MDLITIPFSHYNERARWALDYHRVPYREHGYLPMFHMAAVASSALSVSLRRRRNGSADGSWIGGQRDRVSSPLSVPALRIDDATLLRDSGEIVRWADERYGTPETSLYPPEDRTAIEALEQRFHDELGPHARRYAYGYMFDHPAELIATADRLVSRSQAAMFRVLRPLAEQRIRAAFRVTPENVERSRQKVMALFDEMAEPLRHGPYLVGERFSAADLTFAALASPMLLPFEDFGVNMPLNLNDQIMEQIRELRATQAGKHGLAMYKKHRWHDAAQRSARTAA